jgi:hypothetical protein
MSCLLSPPISIIKKKVFFDKKEKAFFLEVTYSYGKSDVYGPFDTERDAENFL